MQILAYKLPRKHKSLSGFSKTELDKAESHLDKNILRLTPLTTWLTRAFYPVLYIFAESSFGNFVEERLDKIINLDNNDTTNFLIFIMIGFIPFYFGEKFNENHFLKLALAYIETSKKAKDSV
jgi:hypothetical protein